MNQRTTEQRTSADTYVFYDTPWWAHARNLGDVSTSCSDKNESQQQKDALVCCTV